MQDLIKAMAEMMEDELLELTEKYLKEGKSPAEILNAYQKGMSEIGDRYEKGEYFVSELIMAGEMMEAGSEKIKPYLKGAGTEKEASKGIVIVATVEGDIHDIGKNIASTIMELAGYEVINLGEDVPASVIVEEAKKVKPILIGLSGLLTLAYDPMKEVVTKLKEAGLRDEIKVLLGGAQIDKHVLEYVGADAIATDAMANIKFLETL